MSLISQNVVLNGKLKLRNEHGTDIAHVEEKRISDSGNSVTKKRRKEKVQERATTEDIIPALAIDLTPASALFAGDEISDSRLLSDVSEKLKPAWEDDEEETKVDISKVNRLRKLRNSETESEVNIANLEKRLRVQFTKINPTPLWAQSDTHRRNYDDDSSDDEGNSVLPDEILLSTEDLVSKSQKLVPGVLGYSQVVDANAHGPSFPPITSTQFHANGRLLAVAGPRCGLGFYDIDGKHNTNIESLHDKEFPVQNVSFLPDNSRVLLTGRRNFFCVFDLESASVCKGGPLVGRDEKSLEKFAVSPCSDMIAFTGNQGYILLVSSKTLELVGCLKMNGTAESVAFTRNGEELLSHGGDGQIYAWDLRTRTCIFKGADDGCVAGTALCSSPSGNLFAAGSASGIVNVYKKEEFLNGKKKPLKIIENLTTRVDAMKFNHDAQILAICSHGNKNSLKLVHLPSYTVFSNWPPSGSSPLKPRCFDFSPGSGFLAVGNSGKVLLYRLHQYDTT